jgi:hypothetical protein
MIKFARFWQGNCSRATATAWRKAGKLRTYYVGRSVFVDETYDQFIVRQDAELRGR